MTTEIPLTILFADICQSTQLYEKLGDRAAFALVSATLNRLQAIVEQLSGKLIRTIGDEVMCSFDNPEKAGIAACEMHRAVIQDPEINLHRVALRVGLHRGPVIETADDVFGDAVNVAARAVGLARRDQILTTRDTLEHIPNDTLLCTRYIGRITVKGREQKLDFYEIMWREDHTVTMADVQQYLQKSLAASRKTLTLEYMGDRIEIGEHNTYISLGRSGENDMVVPKHFISRMHASIEFRNGKFILADHSTNGLYVLTPGSNPVFVHRDEMTLLAEGQISLGREFHKQEAQIIRFFVR